MGREELMGGSGGGKRSETEWRVGEVATTCSGGGAARAQAPCLPSLRSALTSTWRPLSTLRLSHPWLALPAVLRAYSCASLGPRCWRARDVESSGVGSPAAPPHWQRNGRD